MLKSLATFPLLDLREKKRWTQQILKSEKFSSWPFSFFLEFKTVWQRLRNIISIAPTHIQINVLGDVILKSVNAQHEPYFCLITSYYQFVLLWFSDERIERIHKVRYFTSPIICVLCYFSSSSWFTKKRTGAGTYLVLSVIVEMTISICQRER